MTYSSTSSREGCSSARKREPLLELRVQLEEAVQRDEPADDVLAEVEAVDAEQQELPAPAAQLALRGAGPARAGRVAQGRRVDAHRVGAHPHLASLVVDHAAHLVHLEVEEVGAAAQEVAHVVARVEGDDVVAQQPAEHGLADVLGEHAPVVALRPRDVDELVQEGAGAGGADVRGDAVQLVVVQQHQRVAPVAGRAAAPAPVGPPAHLVDHGLGELLVHHEVAVVPGVHLLGPDVRVAAEVPQVVLDEPQHRVGDDVVVLVVRVGGRGDVAHAVLFAVQRDLHGALLGGQAALGVAQRRRHPGARMVAEHFGEDGDQAAGPARDDRLSRRVVVERHGAAVGGHHETALCELDTLHAGPPPSAGQAPILPSSRSAKSRRSSRSRRGVRNSRRTFSLPSSAIAWCLAGSSMICRQRSAHSAAELTR